MSLRTSALPLPCCPRQGGRRGPEPGGLRQETQHRAAQRRRVRREPGAGSRSRTERRPVDRRARGEQRGRPGGRGRPPALARVSTREHACARGRQAQGADGFCSEAVYLPLRARSWPWARPEDSAAPRGRPRASLAVTPKSPERRSFAAVTAERSCRARVSGRALGGRLRGTPPAAHRPGASGPRPAPGWPLPSQSAPKSVPKMQIRRGGSEPQTPQRRLQGRERWQMSLWPRGHVGPHFRLRTGLGRLRGHSPPQ